MPHFLSDIRLTGLRGLDDLRVTFDYPVSVVAGGNASGKSTVLSAAACAYKVPGAGVRDFVPSTLFPDYRAKAGTRRDDRSEVVLDFEYSTPKGRRSMRWRRSKSWNRSFFGRKGAEQPRRPVYLRALANLTNPSEVRGALAMSHLASPPQETALTPWESEFAQRMFPFRYSEVVDLSSDRKSLLFAVQEGGVQYSELHMAAGERAILRLAKEIAHLEDGLVLIDEVEAGLHPWVQQLLMLQLQKLALQNNLQVIVTSHSPIVLNAVPETGQRRCCWASSTTLRRERVSNGTRSRSDAIRVPASSPRTQGLSGSSVRSTTSYLCWTATDATRTTHGRYGMPQVAGFQSTFCRVAKGRKHGYGSNCGNWEMKVLLRSASTPTTWHNE